MQPQWMFLLSYLLLLSWTAMAEQFYVVPSSNRSCPRKPCYTLTDVLQNPSQYFVSDTVIRFLPGSHKTNITRKLSVLIKDVRNISMIGYDHTNTDSKSVIQCTGPLGFAFINVTTLKIARLSLSSCGAKIFKEFRATTFPKIKVTLYFLRTINATISKVAISTSTDAGIIGVNMFGLTNISQTTLSGNRPNCLILFRKIDSISQAIPPTGLNIEDSLMIFGKAPNNFNSDWGATGLGIMLAQTRYSVYIYMTNITTQNNSKTEKWYGNLNLIIRKWACHCSVIRAKLITSINTVDRIQVRLKSPCGDGCNCSKSAEGEYTVYISDSYFVGLGVRLVTNQEYCDTRIKLKNITIQNSYSKYALKIEKVNSITLQDMNFIYNYNGVLSLYSSRITFSGSCYFINNTGDVSIAYLLHQSTVIFHEEVKFIGNKANWAIVIIAKNSTMKFQQTAELVENKGKEGGAIALYDGSELIIGKKSNVSFLRNHAQLNGGAILVDDSTMVVESEAKMAFTENEAYNGGAIAFQNGAIITLESHSQITFISNHAQQYGGALYVVLIEEPTLKLKFYWSIYSIRCFVQLPSKISPQAIPSLIFSNNTADSAGSSLYGGWIEFCTTSTGTSGVLLYKSIFNFQEAPRLSTVSSYPTRVCICIKDHPDCSITLYDVTAYPGEKFQISAVAVGQMFGTVPFIVYSKLTSVNSWTSSPTQIKALEKTQSVERACTNLTYTIVSSHQIEQMILTVDKLPTQYDLPRNKLPLTLKDLCLNIHLKSCPMGFELNNSLCICHPQLQQHGMNCSINTQKIYRQSPTWINVTFTNGSQNGILVHDHCPFDFCKIDSFDLNLEDPDEQCAFNRSGILCGACQNNRSHVFGTSTCRECSNLWTLLWVPVIALAGIALVVLLILLNLTVTVGTINGLIFYANIVRANHATFFPPNTTNSFLSWFIAWINLDLGIETCFYNGLDAYVKTWLQFVFPLYIWFLVIAIIVLSHYYTLAARLSGRNAVPVLATLFLLSYAKLLRIFITVFSFTRIKYPDKSVNVWLYDGNVNYLEGKHIPLLVAAVVLLLAISVPYTGILLFIQCFQKLSTHKLLSWIHKLKPLFDAYTGPYKDRHRYWTGLLLLVRAALFIIFSVNAIANPTVDLLAITITTFCLITHGVVAGPVYKTWILNAIEYSYLLNLGVLSCATFYTRASDQEDSRGATGQDQKAVVYTSVAIALVTFIVIVMMHIVKKVKSFQRFNRLFLERVNSKLSTLRGRATLAMRRKRPHSPPPSPVVSPTSFQLRESLLEYCVDN